MVFYTLEKIEWAKFWSTLLHSQPNALPNKLHLQNIFFIIDIENQILVTFDPI